MRPAPSIYRYFMGISGGFCSWRPEILWGILGICGVSFPSSSPLFSAHTQSLFISLTLLLFKNSSTRQGSDPLYHQLSPAAHRDTSEDCRSCLECSSDNGCVRCPERLFLFLQREGMSHHGTCLHACPAGHYGQRGKDINRCMSTFLENIRSVKLMHSVHVVYTYRPSFHGDVPCLIKSRNILS